MSVTNNVRVVPELEASNTQSSLSSHTARPYLDEHTWLRSSAQTQVTNPTPQLKSSTPNIQTHHTQLTTQPSTHPPAPNPQPPSPPRRETPSGAAGLAAARGAASSTSSACYSTVTSSPPGLCSALERAARWDRARNSRLSVACVRALALCCSPPRCPTRAAFSRQPWSAAARAASSPGAPPPPPVTPAAASARPRR